MSTDKKIHWGRIGVAIAGAALFTGVGLSEQFQTAAQNVIPQSKQHATVNEFKACWNKEVGPTFEKAHAAIPPRDSKTSITVLAVAQDAMGKGTSDAKVYSVTLVALQGDPEDGIGKITTIYTSKKKPELLNGGQASARTNAAFEVGEDLVYSCLAYNR